MAVAARRHAYTFAEYLTLEATSNVKHEYLDGDIYAMAGGTPRHAALTLAVAAALLNTLRAGPCRAFSSDLRIRVRATGFAAYPDVAVVCGPLEVDPDSDTTVTNPTVLVEVLSHSTQSFDLGEKFEHYQQIPSLCAVIFLWQDQPRIELRSRDANSRWSSHTFGAGEAIAIEALGARLELDALYADAGIT